MPRRNLFAIAMIGAISLLCWQSSQGARPKDEMYELYGLFADAVERVEANYVRPVSRRELFESALRGMLQDLDPHSTYISEGEWRQFKKTIEGSFIGIGIQVGFDERAKRLKVIAPVVGSPAYEAGVLAGDVITEIDGKTTEGLMPDKAVEVLQGKQGTPVKLTVVHPNAEKPETLTMNRAVIDMPSVLGDRRKDDGTWDFMLDKEKKIGYVRITSFSQNTTEELKKVLDELKKDGMKALVLDLRDNPGGLLGTAVEVSDLFVEDGLIVSTKGRNVRDKVYKARKEETYTGFPMVVLINQHSASAAEIVSACLQDHNRAAIVGQRSYGKGSVQNIIPLEDNQSVLKLTTQTYWRPSGKNIHRFKNAKESDEWGVSPDDGLAVRLNDDEYVAWADARRDRDLFARNRAPKDKGKENDKDKTLPEDRQLKKAMEVALAKLDKEKPTK